MRRGRSVDRITYRAIEVLFLVYNFLVRSLPADVFRRIAAPTLRLIVRVIIPRRRIVKNLTAAFGRSYSAATKAGLARGVQENFTRALIDCFLQLADPERARRKVTIEGLENLRAACAKGKGVIALGAHIGNFVLVGTRLGMEGFRVSTLFRMPADERLTAIIERQLPFFYQHVISSRPRGSAVLRIVRSLKRGEIVFILGDNLKKGKVETSLFGQRVHTPRGPVSLALRTGAALVPMYLVRNYNGKLRLIIEPELLLIRGGSVYEDVSGNTRRIVGYLEALIGRYPDQWNWLTVRMRKLPRAAAANKEARSIFNE
jgi:Kdo2-lipid IVA lauroyltransferase/acyltransferase